MCTNGLKELPDDKTVELAVYPCKIGGSEGQNILTLTLTLHDPYP